MMASITVKLLLLITIVASATCDDEIEDRSIKQDSSKLKFEDDVTTGAEDFTIDDNEPRQYGLYEDPNDSIRFPNDRPPNQINPEGQKKRRRRRRKPKNQASPNVGYPGFGPGQADLVLGPDPYLKPQVPNGVYRPHRRPKPSIASEAFSSILSALTSTALYDDKQCVPRMLCEAAGGGTFGSSSLLESVSGLQPLLTLLSAYNGITSSPLFVFGRAVFLGMTAKGNTGTCRYAYPYCPTDPEQLVHYLNNHNGGFFRFFNSPQLNRPQEQNIEQFYNQLSGGYGLHQPNGPNKEYGNQGYGLLEPNLYTGNKGYGYGYDYDKTRPYNRVEERIQTQSIKRPVDDYINEDASKWRFPDDYDFDNDNNLYADNKHTNRGSRTLKFPDKYPENTRYYQYNDYIDNDYNKRENNVKFLDNNRYNNDYRYTPNVSSNDKYVFNSYKYPKDTRVNNDDYEFDYVHNFYVKKNKQEEDVRTIYVVRGNGDPNHPEIIKVRPGESVYK